MARQYTYSAAAGEFTVSWPQAGDKSYKGLAILRNMGDKTVEMLRLTDKSTADEYRSFASAARAAAELADKAAIVAEQAAVDAVTFKLTPAQRTRILDSLKGMQPAARVALGSALGLDLSEFGYLPDGKLKPADKPPAAPGRSAQRVDANAKIDAAIAAAGK